VNFSSTRIVSEKRGPSIGYSARPAPVGRIGMEEGSVLGPLRSMRTGGADGSGWMVRVSDLIIGHPEIASFQDFEQLVMQIGRAGEIHLYFDVKPEFPDTPRQWQTRLELAFYSTDGQRG
jgi:hypothetical protein